MWTIPSPDIQRTDYLVCMGGNPQASRRITARVPRRARRARRASARAAARSSSSTRAAPAPPTTPTSGCRSSPAPTPRSCSRCATCCSPRVSSTLGDARRPGEGRRRRARAVRRLHARSGRRRSAASRPTRSGASPASSRPRRRGAVYGRIGLCNQEFGTLASWLVDVVNILTGNFDRPGGLMFGKPVTWPMAWLPLRPRATACRVRPLESHACRGVPEVLGQVPVVVPRRGDRDARRRPDQGALHDRRQPGDQRARLRRASTRRSPSSSA